jgi:hypothetical protein
LISAVWRSGGCQQFDNLVDGLVGAVVCGFELAVWAMFCDSRRAPGVDSTPTLPRGWSLRLSTLDLEIFRRGLASI